VEVVEIGASPFPTVVRVRAAQHRACKRECLVPCSACSLALRVCVPSSLTRVRVWDQRVGAVLAADARFDAAFIDPPQHRHMDTCIQVRLRPIRRVVVSSLCLSSACVPPLCVWRGVARALVCAQLLSSIHPVLADVSCLLVRFDARCDVAPLSTALRSFGGGDAVVVHPVHAGARERFVMYTCRRPTFDPLCDVGKWERYYAGESVPPWDSGRPESHIVAALHDGARALPCRLPVTTPPTAGSGARGRGTLEPRAIELGCGSGT
jgi:hypothetical protein